MNQADTKQNKTNQAIVSSGELSSRPWPKYLIWCVSLVVLVVIVGGLAIWLNQRAKSDDNISDTETTLLTKAATAIETRDYSTLGKIVPTIKEQADYQKDPNYLYVLASYHIGLNDPAVAEDYLGQLNKVYDPSVGYAKPLQEVVKMAPVKQLSQQVREMQAPKNQSVQVHGLGDRGAPKSH